MARTPGATGKFNAEKEAATIMKTLKVETKEDAIEALVKQGAIVSLNRLVEAATGGGNYSPTNQISAANNFIRIAMELGMLPKSNKDPKDITPVDSPEPVTTPQEGVSKRGEDLDLGICEFPRFDED